VAIYSALMTVTAAEFPSYGVCRPQGATSCPQGSAVDPANGYCEWSAPSSCALGAVCSLDALAGYICKGALGGPGQACDVPEDCKCGLVCQGNFCTSKGGGGAGASCYRACDCQAGLSCLSPLEGEIGSCIPTPNVPDAGTTAAPGCGDHVDCLGVPVSSGLEACNPQRALTCPAGSTLDSMQYCTWSVPSSCPSGQVCTGAAGTNYACAFPLPI
jgi:hypothetical protein